LDEAGRIGRDVYVHRVVGSRRQPRVECLVLAGYIVVSEIFCSALPMLAFDSSEKLKPLGEEAGAVAFRMICIGGSALENTAPAS